MSESPETNNEKVAQMLRMPVDLHRLLKDMADREHRTVPQQIMLLLQRQIEQQSRAA